MRRVPMLAAVGLSSVSCLAAGWPGGASHAAVVPAGKVCRPSKPILISSGAEPRARVRFDLTRDSATTVTFLARDVAQNVTHLADGSLHASTGITTLRGSISTGTARGGRLPYSEHFRITFSPSTAASQDIELSGYADELDGGASGVKGDPP